VEFIQLLSQRTRAEAGLPPEKPSRQRGGRCLKGAWRVIEKMALRSGAIPEGGLDGMPPKQVLSEVLDASRLFDLLRGSIKCDDFTQLVAVLDLLLLLDEELGNRDKARSMGIDLERFAIRLHRFKCRFTTPTSGGWADALVNFSFASDPHKHVVELQLQVRPAPRALPVSRPAHSPFPTSQHATLLVIRKEGGAHEAYAGFRSAFELLEAIGKAPADVFDETSSVDDLSPIEAMRLKMEEMAQRLAALEARAS